MSISDENLRSDFSGRLRVVLAEIGLPQRVVAARIGVAQGYLSEVAAGKKMPSAMLLFGLGHGFGVDLNWLLTGRGEMWIGRTSGATHAHWMTFPDLHQALDRCLSDADDASIARVRGFLEGVEAAGGRPLALKKRA